jgi:hypothetical protein
VRIESRALHFATIGNVPENTFEHIDFSMF